MDLETTPSDAPPADCTSDPVSSTPVSSMDTTSNTPPQDHQRKRLASYDEPMMNSEAKRAKIDDEDATSRHEVDDGDVSARHKADEDDGPTGEKMGDRVVPLWERMPCSDFPNGRMGDSDDTSHGGNTDDGNVPTGEKTGDRTGDSDDGAPSEEQSENPEDSAGYVTSKLSRLKHSCNRYERPLLDRVISPENIKTGYDDIHLHPSAKASLQNMSLAIQHPEEFTYGVLAGSNLTGVLLYGPAGTGKTMLVRAFARQSGIAVLEVSGADVNDKYVGEGEKTIRAIFSVARKLHPCIVFIDEVDGLFGRRGAEDKGWERTQLNQFLLEWDGLSTQQGNEGTVLVVATNRPHDIDDAILRRLPQRILIDVPEVDDRAAILRIYLKDEVLAPDVSIETLAASTPFYTGSDLKNLVVAAAVSCVREMVATRKEKAADDGDGVNGGAGEKPGRRIIEMRHLMKAKQEIRQSTSKEMLVAIREFHSKYGNTAKLD